MKITKREIDRITLPTSGEFFRWDSELKGFGIRVTPSGITYVARGSVRGSSRRPRVKLGRHGPLAPDTARAEARKALGEMAQGVDRNSLEKVKRLAGVTLEEAYLGYISSKSLSANTLHDYEKAMRIAFAPWRNLALVKITGGMVQRRFEEISKRGPTQANQMFRFLRALLGWAMWRYAHDDGTPLMPANPCDVLSKLKVWNPVRRRHRHVEQSQIASFMRALEHRADDSRQRRDVKDLCALLILTGPREQEACRLLVENVDVQRRLITFLDTKNGNDHTIPIGPWLAGRLQARLSSSRARDTSSPRVRPAATSNTTGNRYARSCRRRESSSRSTICAARSRRS